MRTFALPVVLSLAALSLTGLSGTLEVSPMPSSGTDDLPAPLPSHLPVVPGLNADALDGLEGAEFLSYTDAKVGEALSYTDAKVGAALSYTDAKVGAVSARVSALEAAPSMMMFSGRLRIDCCGSSGEMFFHPLANDVSYANPNKAWSNTHLAGMGVVLPTRGEARHLALAFEVNGIPAGGRLELVVLKNGVETPLRATVFPTDPAGTIVIDDLHEVAFGARDHLSMKANFCCGTVTFGWTFLFERV